MRKQQRVISGRLGQDMDAFNAAGNSLESPRRPVAGAVPQVVLWCEQVNLHYAAWLRAFAEMNMCSVKVIASTPITRERELLGWTAPRITPAQVVIANSPTCVDDALADCDANAVHIVEGIRGSWIARQALKRLVASANRIGVISEGCDSRGIRGAARRALYKIHIWRLREKIDFVLAMGEAGVKWYSSCGVPPNRVFPFIYTAETPVASVPSKRTGATNGVVRIVYLGRCVEGKGIQDLLDALNDLGSDKVSLTVIGDGDLRSSLEATVSRSPILRGRVEFKGVLQYQEAVAAISDFDILVLPSHRDGWGVVVNEALMQGVPVICSDMCGSKDLLAESWRGGVFRSGCTQSLSKELRSRVQAGPLLDEQRDQLRMWSRRLCGDSMAKYFVLILAHVYSHGNRPQPAWKS